MKTSIDVDGPLWASFGRKVEESEGKSNRKGKVLAKLMKGYVEGKILV